MENKKTIISNEKLLTGGQITSLSYITYRDIDDLLDNENLVISVTETKQAIKIEAFYQVMNYYIASMIIDQIEENRVYLANHKGYISTTDLLLYCDTYNTLIDNLAAIYSNEMEDNSRFIINNKDVIFPHHIKINPLEIINRIEVEQDV